MSEDLRQKFAVNMPKDDALVLRILAENEELQKDAERYRWLRNEDNWGADDGLWEALGESHCGEFDDLIDERMKVQECDVRE
jgi:hypothetical protein